MKKTAISVAALFVCAALSAEGLPQIPNDPAVRVGKLDNGLTYYIRHNEKPAQRAEFYLATNVGALQETKEQDGLAHFLEHMCFNGTKNFPGKGIINYLEGIGASFGGNVNASTGIEHTIYMLTNIPLVRPSVVDTCLLIIHDYSHFVLCEGSEIDAERGVILEEKRTRNTAGWRNYMKHNRILHAGTPYENITLIGTEEQLKSFEHHHLTDFYHTWYRPDMQAVIVVGDVDVDATEAKLKQIFSDIPAAENPKAKDVIKMVPNAEPRVGIITDPETSSSQISLYWKRDARPEIYNSTPYGMTFDILDEIIYNVMAERFETIASKPDAPFLKANLSSGRVNEIMDAAAGSVSFKDGEYEKALESYLTEVERMRRYGFEDAEIERAKTSILSDYESAVKKAGSRQNREFVSPLIDNFFDNQAFPTPETAQQMAGSIISSLNAEAINKVVSQYVTKENLVVMYIAPEKEGLKKPTEELIKGIIEKVAASEVKPIAGEAIPEKLLDESALKGSKVKKSLAGIHGSEVLYLKNGLKVVLYPTDIEKDKILIDLYKKGGRSLLSDEELFSFEGSIFDLYNRNTGVSNISGNILSKMLSGKKVSSSAFVDDYTHGIYVTSNKKDLETAFQLGYLTFVDPRFDADEWNKGISQLTAILPNIMGQPDYKMQEALTKTMHDSPRSFILNEEVLSKANLATFEKAYRRIFKGAAGATAVITGDFTKEEIIPLVEKYLGSIKKDGKATDWKYCGDSFVSESRVKDFTTKMEAPKTSVIQMWKADRPYTVESRVSFNALRYILNMLYVETLREQEGGTYGAGVGISSSKKPYEYMGLYVMFDTNNAQADALRTLAAKGVKDIAENGPTDEQFDKTVKYFKKQLPESKLRLRYWEGVFENQDLYGFDSLSEYEKALSELTPEKVKAAAAELVGGYFSEIIMRGE